MFPDTSLSIKVCELLRYACSTECASLVLDMLLLLTGQLYSLRETNIGRARPRTSDHPPRPSKVHRSLAC